MKKYFAIIGILVIASAVAAMIAPRLAESATESHVRLIRERALLLQGYLDLYANEHFNFYPPANRVDKVGLNAPLWPANPWTGKPLTRGARTGQYEYVPGPKLLSYTLIVHYPGGKITLRRSVPDSRKRQNDHRTREGLELVQQFIEKWSRSHNNTYPDPADVSAKGGVGQQKGVIFWPHDPWTHTNMSNKNAWGHFTYQVTSDHHGYTLEAHYSRKGTFILSGGTLATD